MTIVTKQDEDERPDLFWSVARAFEPKAILEDERIFVFGRIAFTRVVDREDPVVRDDRLVARPALRFLRRKAA